MKNRARIMILISIVFLGAMSRLLPHPPNFTAIGALTLFGAAHFSKKWMGLAIAFLALFLSDLILNNVVYANAFPEFYSGFTWFGPSAAYVFGSFILIFLIGYLMLKKVRTGNLIIASLMSSAVFFLVTNFGSWVAFPNYPPTLAGLATCYVAGLPFFLNTIAGDLFFSALFFGSFYWIDKRVFSISF